MGGGIKEKMIWGRENSQHSRKKEIKVNLNTSGQAWMQEVHKMPMESARLDTPYLSGCKKRTCWSRRALPPDSEGPDGT